MSARTYAEAVRIYQQRAQRLISCVSSSVFSQNELIRFTVSIAQVDVGLMLNRGNPSRLDGSIALTIEVSQRLRITQDSELNRRLWTTAIVAYSYILRDENDAEVCAYQWHPAGISHVLHPHLHIGRGATGNVTTFGPRGLHRIHFPTKQIELEDVLRLAITEFGVEPRRDNWEQILSGP